MTFRNIYKQEFSLKEMVNEIKDYVNEEMDEVYRLIIGTDSLYTKRETSFVTAVIIHRVSRGARFFYTKYRLNHDIDICTRILKETEDSIKVMREIEYSELIYLIEPDNFEIHIDAGENGKSKQIIKECINYVKGFGYNYKVKPDSCGASHVADRYV